MSSEPASHNTLSAPSSEPCAGCQVTGLPLLACDDPEVLGLPPNVKPRFCAQCMIGKKVRVFWPVDNSWYAGIVQQYDPSTGEHLLRYDDGDTEWVKIGESGPSGGPVRNASPTEGGGGMEPVAPVSPGGAPLEPGMNTRDSPPSQNPPRLPPFSNEPPPQGGSPDHKWQGPSGIPPGRPGMGMPQNYPPYPGGPGAPPPPPQGLYSSGPPGYMGGIPPGPYPSAYPVQPGPYPGGPPPPYGYPPAMGMPGGPPGSGPGGKRTSEPGGSPTSSGATSKRKAGPKAWTKEEDALLLSMVQSMRMPMKWSIVAQSMPDRTGKQCRERYVNHLNPRLKVSDWSPVEDATIFHLYNTSGSHWAKMSKMIPGRTDNGIKNRFHNLRRQLEREDEHRLRLSKAKDFPGEIRLDRLREFPKSLRGRSDDLWDMRRGIGILAAQSVLGGGIARNAGRFGPFRSPQNGEQCVRCGLLVPSVQCGTEICTKTGWCQSCTRIPPHVSGNLLRECLNLRRCQDAKQREIVESWEDFFRADGEAPGEDTEDVDS